MIEIVGASSGLRIALEHTSVRRVQEIRKCFGGAWAGCQISVSGSRFKLWPVESYGEVMVMIRAAETGQQNVAREPDGDVVSGGLRATPTPQTDPPV